MSRFFIILSLFLAATFAYGEEEKILNIYNWSNYIPPQIIKQFEQESGIKIQYDVYDSDQILDAKLMSGKTGYDIVVPADSPFFARQVSLGIYQPIPKNKLKNYKDLDKNILRQLVGDDPGNKHGIPWMITTVGFGYNATKVKEFAPNAPLDSLAILFDLKYAAQLSKCGINILDSSIDLVPAALTYLGLNPNTSSLDDLEKARELLFKIRPFITEIDSGNYITNLANGDVCLAFGFSGDVLQAMTYAKETKNSHDIRFFVPKEGFMVAFDVLAIPKNASHPENAIKFINFLLQPKITAQISNEVGYPSANLASYQYLNPEIRNNKTIFPDAKLLKKSYRSSLQHSGFVRKRNRIWTNFVSLQ